MRTALIVVATMLTTAISHAGTLPTWDKIPGSTREIIVKQYIAGYLAGINRGLDEGIKSVISYTKATGDNTYIDEKQNVYTICSNMISNNLDRIYDESRGWQQLQPKETGYYVNELTTFLKQYPQCNKLEVTDLIEIMTPVWLNMEKKVGYEDVARGCGK